MVPGRLVSHLPGTVAALAAQVLAMDQQAGGTGALQGQPRVDEGRGTTVVIHKERLRRDGKNPRVGHENIWNHGNVCAKASGRTPE